ncbi:MAG TPA: pyridoxamine 5'-phosphate oxidase family protein [Candidatus Dormibacteraeota bacterium]|nr:pyridoxamine 5'-phosphate oxidase family protein [Candidatus Dormibacteraeota bacterium]
MGKSHAQIDDTLAKLIEEQHVFFVATAPLASDGSINLSPKGLDSFRILGPKTVAYLDVVGSGVETIAHLKENGRIVLMFCMFEGPPNIVRLHGRGRVVEPNSAEFAGLAAQFPAYESTRSIIVVEITRISDSCGFGVPLMKYEGDRNQHFSWADKKGPEGLKTYKQEKNRRSIEGLPGLAE